MKWNILKCLSAFVFTGVLMISCENNRDDGIPSENDTVDVIAAITSDEYEYEFAYDDSGRLVEVKMVDLLFDGLTENYFLSYEGDSIVRLSSDGYKEVFVYGIEGGKVTSLSVDEVFPEVTHIASYRYDGQGYLQYIDWPEGVREKPETYTWDNGNLIGISGLDDTSVAIEYESTRNTTNLDFIYLISTGYLNNTAELSIPNLMIISGYMGPASYSMPVAENVSYEGYVYQRVEYAYGLDENGRIISVDITIFYDGVYAEKNHVTITYM